MLPINYRGFEVEVMTHGRLSGFGHFTEILINGVGEVKLDFADQEYGLELAKHMVDLRLGVEAPEGRTG